MKRIDVYALSRFLILVALLIGVVYAGSKIDSLSKRLERIETRFGGQEKIGCNEKDSIEKVRQSVVRIIGGESEGSGFAIKDGGIILTNFHVIEFEPSPKVILPDNTFQTAEILMADKNVDLANVRLKEIQDDNNANYMALNKTIDVLGDLYKLYKSSDTPTRHMYHKAFFEAIVVDEKKIIGLKWKAPFSALYQPNSRSVLQPFGEPPGSRTRNLFLKRELLCQLS